MLPQGLAKAMTLDAGACTTNAPKEKLKIFCRNLVSLSSCIMGTQYNWSFGSNSVHESWETSEVRNCGKLIQFLKERGIIQ